MDKFWKEKKVTIAGGLGMMGSNLAHRLVGLGAKVTVLDTGLFNYGGNMHNLRGIEHKLKIRYADIKKDDLSKIVAGQDIFYQFAAQVSHNQSITNPLNDLEINVRGNLNVLEALRNHNPSCKVIFSGSRLQYGKTKFLPISEDHPRNPESIYAADKNVAEDYYQIYSLHHNIRTTCFRIGNPYGERSQMKSSQYSLLNWFIRQAIENKPITIFSPGTQVRDYIYVQDLVDAMVEAGHNNKTNGQVYNLASGYGTRLIDAAHLIVNKVGSGEVKMVSWPKDNLQLHVETGDSVLSVSKLMHDTKWKPQTSFEEGISRTVAFYKDKENWRHYAR